MKKLIYMIAAAAVAIPVVALAQGACGSGSCATIVAAVRRGLTDRKAEIVLDGGSLFVEWTKEDEVLMQGAVNMAFSGTAYL